MPKPNRPDGCPLFPHANKQWAKKVKGKLRYCGSWDDLDVALAKYEAETTPDTYARVSNKPYSVPARPKPAKPQKDFPLCAHGSGQWARKIKGKPHYFGAWPDPQAALDKYLAQRDDLLAGRKVSNGDGLTVRDLGNHFLRNKKRLVRSGDLKQHTWDDYYTLCKAVTDYLGKSRLVSSLTPTDFEELREEFAKRHGTHALRKDVTCIRSLFSSAFDADLIDRPVKSGKGFKAPTKVVMRREQQERGTRHGTVVGRFRHLSSKRNQTQSTGRG